MCRENDDAKLAYLGGLWEGEGCANIAKRNRTYISNKFSYECSLIMNMTDYEPIKAMQNQFGGNIKKVDRSKYHNCQDIYVWCISGRKSGIVAKAILPYVLASRRREALKCVIEFTKSIKARTGRTPIKPDIIIKREQLFQKCKSCNAKGRTAQDRNNITIEIAKIITPQLSLW